MTKEKLCAGWYVANIGPTKYNSKPAKLHIKQKHTHRYGNVWYVYDDMKKEDCTCGEGGILGCVDGKDHYGFAADFQPTLKEALAEVKSWEL